MVSSFIAKFTAAVEEGKPPENDLDRAWQTLSGKLSSYTNYWNYYDGDQPLMYTSKRMSDVFKKLSMAKFVENWCSVVIDAASDRIQLKSLDIEAVDAQKILTTEWESLNLSLEASDIHEAALVIGESFLIVWEEDSGDGDELQVFYNDPRLCHMFYNPGNPRKKDYAAKWWVDSDSLTRMTLYYPDRLEYYRTKKKGGQISKWNAFEPYNPTEQEGGEVSENPYGEIPVFHFRVERRIIKSDLVNAIPIQNGINKLRTDMMVAAEFGAFKQRWVISNADTSNLKNAPNIIWEIPSGDGEGQKASTGQFDATDLDNYINAIDSMAATLAIITRTPKHYLFQQSGAMSGEALIAMEAPLNKRCEEHIGHFKPTWKDVARFILKIRNKEALNEDITVTFNNPSTIQPLTQSEIRTNGRTAGIPLVTLLREEGRDEAWIEQMEADKKAADDASPMLDLLSQVRDNPLSREEKTDG